MEQENDFTNRSYKVLCGRADDTPQHLTPSLFVYVAVIFVAHVFWRAALAGTLIPRLVFDGPHAMALVAIFGATISPYLSFWQSSQEVKEAHRRCLPPLRLTPGDAAPERARIRIDNVPGMGISNVIASHCRRDGGDADASGVTDVQTCSQARSGRWSECSHNGLAHAVRFDATRGLVGIAVMAAVTIGFFTI